MENKKFLIRMPLTGVISFIVEAENEEDAKQKVENISEKINIHLKTEGTESVEDIDLEEWSLHNKIVEGNIFHGILNDVDIQNY